MLCQPGPILLSASAAGPPEIKTVWQGAWDRLHPFYGRYQPGFGPEGRSNVHHGLRRLGIQCQSRWVQSEHVTIR